MGGSVNITFRFEDGTEERMCRWTNILGWIFKNSKFLKKDPEHLKNVLKQWHEMRADWLANKDKPKAERKFEFAMTECYAPYANLAPSEYGLVVVDQVNNVILDMQGYTRLNTVDECGIQMRTEFDSKKKQYSYDADPDGEFLATVDLIKGGHIKTMEGYDPNPRPVPPELGTPEGLLRFIHKDRQGTELPKWHVFNIDMAPFKYEVFADEPKGCKALLKRVKELGFKLSPQEHKMFKEWHVD